MKAGLIETNDALIGLLVSLYFECLHGQLEMVDSIFLHEIWKYHVCVVK